MNPYKGPSGPHYKTYNNKTAYIKTGSAKEVFGFKMELEKKFYGLLEWHFLSSICWVSLWMPARRQPYQHGALYLPKGDQRGSHRHAACLIFYWLAPRKAYLLLAGCSVKLIFIGWLLLRTACKPCRAEVEVEGGAARMTGTDADSSITSVGKTYSAVSTFRADRQSSYCLCSPLF